MEGEQWRLFFEKKDKLFSAFIDHHRLSRLGNLTQGIVHNLNGTLQVLSMHMEMLQGMLTKDGHQASPAIQNKMKKCLDHFDALRGMVESLGRKGSQADDEGPRMINVNNLIEEGIWFLKNNLFFKHEVKVKKEFSSKLPLLKGYPADFGEGLLSFIQNAIEAMEESPQKKLSLMTESKIDHLLITIGDTGIGVSEEIKPHLFHPFFTTKGKKHYGMGLFIARELLTPYGASFDYASEKGETFFSLRFPLKADQVPGS